MNAWNPKIAIGEISESELHWFLPNTIQAALFNVSIWRFIEHSSPKQLACQHAGHAGGLPEKAHLRHYSFQVPLFSINILVMVPSNDIQLPHIKPSASSLILTAAGFPASICSRFA
jgi:hypothetical protein